MTRCVVDASVAAKWYFPEQDSDLALQWMPAGQEDRREVAAPELIVYEMGNLALRKVRLGEVDETTAHTVLSRFLALPVRMIASMAALDVGCRLGVTYHDAWYLAIAVELDTILVTADKDLDKLTRGTPFAEHVKLLADSEAQPGTGR